MSAALESSIVNMLKYGLALAIVLFSVLSFSQGDSSAVMNFTGIHLMTYLPSIILGMVVDLKDPLHEGLAANNTLSKML